MTRELRFLPEALREARDAFVWYERQRPGLGRDFLEHLHDMLSLGRRVSELHRAVGPNTRRALLLKYPYVVYYALNSGEMIVTAVFHSSRDPRRWSDRVHEQALNEGRMYAAAFTA